MKYLVQFGIITGISFVAEMLYILLPFPVPASVYGLVLLFVLLCTKVIKLDMVEDTADFFVSIMPVIFIPSSVAIVTTIDALKGNILKLFFMCLFSTIIVTGVTGLVSQAVIRIRRRKKKS